jgi:hypothetical protein
MAMAVVEARDRRGVMVGLDELSGPGLPAQPGHSEEREQDPPEGHEERRPAPNRIIADFLQEDEEGGRLAFETRESA